MLRVLAPVLAVVCLVAAANLYRVTFQTRAHELALKQAERDLEELSRTVATLRAERDYLARPQAIAPLARKLGLRPARGEQYVPVVAQDGPVPR